MTKIEIFGSQLVFFFLNKNKNKNRQMPRQHY